MATLGEAAVEIIAETGDFDDDLRRRLQRSVDESAREMQDDLRRVQRQAEQTGRSLREEIGEGAGRASRDVERMERITRAAEQALEDMDPEQLRRVADQAQRSRSEMQEMVRAARAGEGAFARMDPERVERIARGAEEASRDMDRLGRRARQAADEVDRFGDSEEIHRLAMQIERARREAERLNQTRFRRIGGEARQAGRAIFRAFGSDSERARRELERIDDTRFREVVRRAQRAADQIGRTFRRVGDSDQLGKSVSRVTRGFAGILAGGAALASLTAAVAGLVHILAALVAVLAPSLGLLAGLPAAALLAGAAFGTLKLALHGVGDAMKAALSGDAAKLDEALKKLAPSARKVVLEVSKLRPQLDRLRKSVQGEFFGPLVGEVTELARNLLGPLKRGMSAAAEQFGRLALGVTTFGRSAEAVRLVDAVFGQLRDQLSAIKTTSITGLLDSISRFTRATLPGFDGLGDAIDRTLGRLSDFLRRSADSGDALRWLETGKAQAAALGHFLADVGRIVLGVGKAMQTASEGMLGSLGRLADDLGTFATSAQGQAQLVEVFKAINAVAAQTGPVITALVGGLASLSPTLASLFSDLGPTLVAAIDAAVPALQGILDGLLPVFAALREAVTSIADTGALGALGRGLGALLAAVAPLLPAIGDVLVSAMRSLAVAAQAVAPVLHLVASAMAAVASSPLGAALGPLVAQLLLVRLVTGSWSTALKSLVPVLKLAGKAALFFGRALIGLVVANPVTAVIVAIVAALVLLLSRFEAVRSAVSRVTGALREGFGRLKEFGAGLLNTFKTEGPVAALRELASGIVSGLTAAITRAAALAPRLLGALLRGIASAIALVPRMLGQLGDAIAAGLARIRTDVPRLARNLLGGLRDAWASLREQGPLIKAALGQALREGLDVLRTEGPKIGAALGELLRVAFGALTTYGPELAQRAGEAFRAANAILLRLAADGIRRAGDAIAANLPGLATRIATFLSGLITRAGEVIPQVLNGLAARIRGGLDQAVGNAASGGEGSGGARLRQSLVDLLINVGTEFARQLVRLAPIIAQAMGQISMSVTRAAIAAAPGILAAFNNLMLAIAQALLSRLLGFLASLPARIVAALTPMSTATALAGQQSMLGLLRGIIAAVPGVLSYIAGLPGRIVSALNPLSGLMGGKGRAGMFSFGSSLTVGGNSSVAKMAGLPGRLAGALNSLAGLLGGKGSAAMSALTSRLSAGASGAVSAVRSLTGRIPGALSGLPGQMRSLGSAVMAGFVSGVQSWAGRIASAVVAPIRNAISAAHSVLQTGSPSKVFAEIGKFVGQGFVKGMTGEADDIKKTAEKLVSLVIKAFKGRKTLTDDRLVAFVKKQNKKLQALAKDRAKIAETIKAASDKAAEVAKAAADFASLTGAASALGSAAAGGVPLSARGLAAQLRRRLNVVKQFRKDLADLARRGLSDDLIAQLVAAGPDAGGDLARALAVGDNSAIAELNRTADEIASVSKGLGRDAADLLYDSGLAAGKGFLAGLKAQEDDITKLMTKLAEKVAATVKKTLKIRSPSKVMAGLGTDTMAGYLAGLEALAPQIERTMHAALAGALERAEGGARLALPRPRRPSGAAERAGLGAVAPDRAGRGPRRFGDGWHTRPQVIRQTTVNAPVNLTIPTPDPEQAARVISERITEKATR